MLKHSVCSFKDVDPEAWTFLQNHSSICDIFQTHQWAKVIRVSSNTDCDFLMISDRNQLVGGFFILKQKALFGPLKAVEVRGGPLCLKGYESDVMESLASYMNKVNIGVLYRLVQPSPLLNSRARKVLIGRKYGTIKCDTFILDLKKTKDELWNGLNKRARWGVRKSERLGVKVREANSEYEWNAFYHLHVHHCLTHNYLSSLLSPMLFEQLYRILYPSNMAKLLLAKLDDKIVAGTLVLSHRRYFVYFRNASLDKYLGFEPNNLLQWRSIMIGKENGGEIYDMGGILEPRSKESFLYGLYKYKEKWGGQLANYNYYYKGLIFRILATSFFESSLMRRTYETFRRASVRYLDVE